MAPDYAAHLIAAETEMKSIYPAMCDMKYTKAFTHALGVIRELQAFMTWVIVRKAK